MKPENASQLVARFVIGQVSPEEVVEWALTCLQQGVDSPTLPVVAGYTNAELARDVHGFRDDVSKVFRELDFVIPSVEESREVFTRYLCNGIISGTLDGDKAHFELYELWRESNYQPELAYNSRLEPFMYLSDSLGLVEMGEEPVVNGLTSENYLDYLKLECVKYLEGEKPTLGEQGIVPNP